MLNSPGTVTPPAPSWGSAMVDAFLGALGRPGGWAVALLGFLVRGGMVVLVAPIVAVPSTITIVNAVAPTVTPLLFGEASPDFTVLVGAAIVGLTAWVVLGGLVGAWADHTLVRTAAADEDVTTVHALPARAGAVWRALGVRLIAYVPLALAVAWGATRIIDAAYRQVILPDELATPIVLRILLDAPDAVGLVLAAWLFGEAVGGIAQRRLWSSDASMPGALGWAVGRVVRRPLTTAGTLVLTSVVVVVAVLPPSIVAGIAWDRLRIALASDAPAFELAISLGLFVALWLSALLLTGAATTLRSFAWTAETYRPIRVVEPALDARTIGDARAGRPGEWPSAGASGSL